MIDCCFGMVVMGVVVLIYSVIVFYKEESGNGDVAVSSESATSSTPRPPSKKDSGNRGKGSFVGQMGSSDRKEVGSSPTRKKEANK